MSGGGRYAGTSGPRLRKWRWPPTGPYNGFSSEERIRGWQVSWWLRERGHLPPFKALTCSICRAGNFVNVHLEDYFDPYQGGIALCGHCHRALHRRFKNPDGWRNVLLRNGCDLEVWAERLTPAEDADLATFQVGEYGEIVRTCTLFIPDREWFPLDQLHPLKDGGSRIRERQLKLDLWPVVGTEDQ